MLNFHIEHMIDEMSLLPTGIIPIINKALGKVLSELGSKNKAVSECGWIPYNKKLLIHTQFCDTTTMKDIETDKKRALVTSKFMESTSYTESIHSNDSDSIQQTDPL